MMTEKKIPLQVEESEQPKTKEEAEQMHDWHLAQQIEHVIEVTNMELGQEPQSNTNLML